MILSVLAVVVINCFKLDAGYWLSISFVYAFLTDWNADCYCKSTQHFILIGRIIFFGLAAQEINLAAMLINNMAARWLSKDCNGLAYYVLHQGVEIVVKLVPIGLREFRWLDPKPRLMRNLDCV